MRFSTGGASRTQSFTSTISPHQKSSNSSGDKKSFSPTGRVILASRPGTRTKMNNNYDDQANLQSPQKSELIEDLNNSNYLAGNFT